MDKDYKGSLRLDWINKDQSLFYEIDEKEGRGIRPVWVDKNDIRVSEPRILNFEKSYGDPESENMLIRGDNLLVLRTLVEQFKDRKEKNKVKCCYIDPPYNTGTAFDNYDDNLEHSEWLTLMRDRLLLIKKLLRFDGLIFISIDDDEVHYLKILMDEIFGRENFVNTIIVKPANPVGLKMKNAHKRIVRVKEYILVYAKDYPKVLFKPQYVQYENYAHFNLYLEKNKSEDPDKWEVIPTPKLISKKLNKLPKDVTDEEIKGFAIENLDKVYCSSFIADRRDRIEFSQKNPEKVTIYKNPDGTEMYMYKKRTLFPLMSKAKKFGNTLYPSEILCDLWLDIKWDGIATEGGVTFLNGKKPEKLIQRIADMTTQPGDLILDSFAGCGTTGATSHKMGRRWIMVELGQHADTHCIKRLKSVISGEDQSGISKEVNWKGGGGFKYYKLGESLISGKDINWNLTYEQIAQALFYSKNFKLIEDKDLAKKHIFLGKNLNERDTYALCTVSKNCEFIKVNEYLELIKYLTDKYDYEELNIYTNKAVNVRKEDMDKDVFIRKIPQTILKKYGMI